MGRGFDSLHQLHKNSSTAEDYSGRLLSQNALPWLVILVMNKFSLLPKDFHQYSGIYLTAILLVIVAGVFLLVMQPILQQPLAVSSYSQCIHLDGSIIQESYPSVCITEDGQRFVQPTPQASQSGLPIQQ